MVEQESEVTLIDMLQTHLIPVEAEDTMAEAGRKVLLGNFITLLENEQGSRTGEDIENVHQMRVATRRMRSAFRLLEDYYKPKVVSTFTDDLQTLAKYLGGVRDLDVMIADLEKHAVEVTEEEQGVLQDITAKLDKRRKKARKRLVSYLDSKDYAEFVKKFSKFVTKPGKGASTVDETPESPSPHQVRHITPVIIHTQLAEVRAYDNVLEESREQTLHNLRIAFKRLRYVTTFFVDVLGKTGSDFIDEIKDIQDTLGHINDVTVARQMLHALNLNDEQSAVVDAYLDKLTAEQENAIEGFSQTWEKFNTRTVQSKLSNALLALK